MVSWLKTQEADVNCLSGTQWGGPFYPPEGEKKLEELARQWGHPYTLLFKRGELPHWYQFEDSPVKLKRRMLGGFWHGMLHAETRV